MQVLSEPRELSGAPCPVSVAIGVFDGVHLGHQQVVRRLREAARREGARAVVVTFDPHPSAIVAPHRTPLAIQPVAQRLATLASLEVDATWLISFDEPFSRLTGEAFVQLLAEGFKPLRTVHVGTAFTFGHHRSGNVALLRRLGGELGFAVDAVEPVLAHGGVVSSTRLRELIQRGDLATASALMGRPYSLSGRVEEGDRLGRRLGAPTANLRVTGLALPPFGVYAVHAVIAGDLHPAVANLGVRPTVVQQAGEVRLEAHLLDGGRELYGETIGIRFHRRLRAEQRFSSVGELQAQIQADIRAAREALAAPV